MIWLYRDTGDVTKIAELSVSTFWLVLPTLPMFLLLPWLLRHGWGFYAALTTSLGAMLVCYVLAVPVLARFGVSI